MKESYTKHVASLKRTEFKSIMSKSWPPTSSSSTKFQRNTGINRYCIKLIKELDEAHEYVTMDTFDYINAMNMKLDMADFQVGFRNLKEPLVQISDFSLQTKFIEALLNHDDDSEFILMYDEMVFERYSQRTKLRKLLPKNFYDAKISTTHFRVNVQGHDTLLMMYDINWFFKRWQFADLCDSFPQNYKIEMGFTPLDLLRYRYHGKLGVTLENNEVVVYKDRNFRKFDPRLRLRVSKIEVFQQVNYLEWLIKNISIAKDPMKEYETQFMRIPLIECILRFQYNLADINNHYRNVGCTSIPEYLENIKDYSTHNIAIELMVHVPSLRKKDSLEPYQNKEILPYFIKQSRVPVLHFQRSYMSLIYDFMCEYIFKKDYSVKQNVTQYPINYDIRSKVLVSDFIGIFTDFDYDFTSQDVQENRESMLDESRNRHTFTQEQFLENYNGILVSFENFFVMNHIEIIHIIDFKTDRMKFRIGDAECQLECFKISYLAPKNLLCIRDKNFSNFRRSAREDDNFDDIIVFCEKFGLNYDDFKISANTKKTIFPHREEAESNYEPSDYMPQPFFNLKQEEEFTDYEDFVFSNKDTIAVVLLAKYKKNDEIEMHDFLNLSEDISDIGKTNTSGFDTNENVKVTHNITVIGLRLLYTLNIEYLFYHHFFEIFNLEEYKTSDYIRLSSKNNYDPFSQYKSYKKLKKAQAKKGNRFIADLLNEIEIENKEGSFENVPNVKKELFMVLDVVDPQFNFQNELSNSQLLIFGEGTMKVHIFNYLFKDPTNPRKKYSIKKQIRYFLKKMRAYVAPTDIDIINPTFWLNTNEGQPQGEESDGNENIGMENLLRKIMEIEKFTLNFDYTNKDFSSFTRPLLTIEIKIQDSLCTFSPTNWWHLVFVLKSILFATGEKSIEKIQKDKLCESELKEIKIDRLREMIQEKLQTMTKSNEMANRPIVEKKILIEINKG